VRSVNARWTAEAQATPRVALSKVNKKPSPIDFTVVPSWAAASQSLLVQQLYDLAARPLQQVRQLV
jgi:hypothetical protein